MLSACGGGGGGGVPPLQQVTFGIVRADAPTAVDVQVANPLAAAATVEELGGAGGLFAPAPGALPAIVPSGGLLTLRVVFTPDAPGARAGQIRLRFVAGREESEVVLKLDAIVETPMVSLLTPTLAFPTALIGEVMSRDIRVRNPNQFTPVDLTSIGVLPADFATDFQPGALLAGDTATIHVTYEPTAPNAFDFQIGLVNSLGAPLRVRVTARADTWLAEKTIDFGTVGFTQGSTTDWLEVEVPAVAISLSIEAVGSSSSTNAGLLGLEGPGGKIYETAQGTGPFVWDAAAEGVLAATLPSSDNPNAQLVPGGGTYRFRLYRASGGGTSFHVRAIIENRDGVPANEGQLDLNVFLVPILGITGPETDTKLQDVLTRVDDLLSQVNLHVGAVSYYQLNNTAYEDVSSTEFPKLLQESSVASETRANVFFVRSAFGTPGVLGIAGAIAAPKLNGTGVSGVLVDYDFGDATVVGLVAAHEIGHLLGLYHTTESDGSFDIITDTLQCPATANCGNYLMFWDTLGYLITPGQAHVILAHPLVDPLPALASLSALAQKKVPALEYVHLPAGFCGTCAKGK